MPSNSKSSLENISREDINKIALDVAKLARTSSKYIYIYSYSKSKSEVLNKLVQARKIASRTKKSGVIDASPSKIKARTKSGFFRSRSTKFPRHKEFLSQRNMKWAIRIDGESEPLKRNFTSKETAIAFAKSSLINKGIGESIIIV